MFNKEKIKNWFRENKWQITIGIAGGILGGLIFIAENKKFNEEPSETFKIQFVENDKPSKSVIIEEKEPNKESELTDSFKTIKNDPTNHLEHNGWVQELYPYEDWGMNIWVNEVTIGDLGDVGQDILKYMSDHGVDMTFDNSSEVQLYGCYILNNDKKNA